MRSPRSGLILFVQRALRHVAGEVIGTSRLVGIVTITASAVEAGRTDQYKIVNLLGLRPCPRGPVITSERSWPKD
jgi:hypothetical protein